MLRSIHQYVNVSLPLGLSSQFMSLIKSPINNLLCRKRMDGTSGAKYDSPNHFKKNASGVITSFKLELIYE